MNTSKAIYDFVMAHPLCYTEDIANHINRTQQQTAKLVYMLEERDALRSPLKDGRRNRWIIGTNNKFNTLSKPKTVAYRGGNPYGAEKTGAINRKRAITVAVTVNDAMALLSAGITRLEVK